MYEGLSRFSLYIFEIKKFPAPTPPNLINLHLIFKPSTKPHQETQWLTASAKFQPKHAPIHWLRGWNDGSNTESVGGPQGVARYTPDNLHVEPKNWWFVGCFSFSTVFSGSFRFHVDFPGCLSPKKKRNVWKEPCIVDNFMVFFKRNALMVTSFSCQTKLR